jgi:hypothetical protein
MQPLKLLNNVQKARLLHSLLSEEIPGFLAYFKDMAGAVVSSQDELKKDWKDQLFGADFWIELAEEAGKKLSRYPKDLAKSAGVFSDQLFGGYNAIFTVHALNQYILTDAKMDVKFKQAVTLLFT